MTIVNEHGNQIIPETGYGILRYVPPGETASGIIMADEHTDPRGRLLLVATSGAYVVDGMRQECTARVGDYVFLSAHPAQKRDPRGKMVQTMQPRLSSIHGLKDHMLCMLVDITHIERPTNGTH